MAKKAMFKSSARSKRKRDRKKIGVKKKEFKYCGLSVDELKNISVEDLLPLLH